MNRSFDLAKIISPSNPWEFLGFALVSYMLALTTKDHWSWVVVGVVFILMLFIVWVLYDRQRKKKYVFKPECRSPLPAKGLILLISSFRPGCSIDNLEEKVRGLLDARSLKESDFSVLGLMQSNLLPQIRAVDFHALQGNLRDIWFICTEPQGKNKGSVLSGDILKAYLESCYGTERFTIHHHSGLQVNPQFDDRLWKIAEDIFRTSGYRDDVVVADVTGGTKMMSIAIAMACIQPGRSMQYMDTPRNDKGEPITSGEMVPVEINYDQIIYHKGE